MNYSTSISFLTALLSLSTSSMAAIPVTMWGPKPALASIYSPGSSNTVIYTITNNVPNASFPIKVSGISAPLARTTVANDCGNFLSKGPSTCNIGVLISPAANNAGKTISQQLSVDYQGRTPLTSSLAFQVSPGFIAVGQYANAGAVQFPFLALASDNGTHWTYLIDDQKLPSGYVNRGRFHQVNCTNNLDLCVAIGYYGISDHNLAPMLAASANGGAWSYSIDLNNNLPADFSSSGGGFNATALNQSQTTKTIAAGFYLSTRDNNSYPLIGLSQNNAQTWTYPINSTSVLPSSYNNGGDFLAAQCSQSTGSQICIAAGTYFYGDGTIPSPLVALSINGGSTWSYPIDSSVMPAGHLGHTGGTFPASGGRLEAATCNGTSNCIATGYYTATDLKQYPLLTYTNDTGMNWSYSIEQGSPNLPSGYSNYGALTSVTCSNTSCITGGYYSATDNKSYLMLALSTNQGQSWTYPIDKSHGTLPTNFSYGAFNAVSCNGSICIAAGNYADSINFTTHPLLALSNDSGTTWTYRLTAETLPADFTNGSFTGANCRADGAVTSCIASGSYTLNGINYPFTALSKDSGATWSYAVTSNMALPSDFANGGLIDSVAGAF